jgi:hypothetical protein
MNTEPGIRIQKRIIALEQQINELKAHWPAHSVPAALMEQLDALEEALAAEKVALDNLKLELD